MGKRGKALKRRRAGLEPTVDSCSKGGARFITANEESSASSGNEDDNFDADEIEREQKRLSKAASPGNESVGGASSALLGGLTEQEVDSAIKVVTLLGEKLDLFRSRPFKQLRVAIHPLVAEQVRRYQADGAATSAGSNSNGTNRRDDRRSRLLSADPNLAGSNRGRLAGLAPAERLKQMDRDALNARLLRTERLEKLDALNADGEDEEVARLRVPDGVAGLMLTAGSSIEVGASSGSAKLLFASGSAGSSDSMITTSNTGEAGSSEAQLATTLESQGLVVHMDAPAPSAAAAKLNNSIG